MKIKLLFLSFLLFANGLFAQNLIINGDAESAPLTDYGWVVESGNWIQRTDDPTAQHGENYFFAGANSLAVLYQEIDVSDNAISIDHSNQTYVFSCYLRSWHQFPTDEAIATIEYIGDTRVLYTYTTGSQFTTDEWVFFEDTAIAPKGTRTIKITLTSIRHKGENNDGYFDNLQLTLLDSPSSSEEITESTNQFSLYPNPSNSFIKVVGLEEQTKFIIYNALGSELLKGKVSKEDKINIQNLDKGLYFLSLENGKLLKFLKD